MVKVCTWGVALAACLALACAEDAPPPPGLAPEPIAADGRLPPGVEAMLFGGSRGCREDADCESNSCEFGGCVGLVTSDTRWRVEHIGRRVRERLAIQPELGPHLVRVLGEVAMREEMGIAFRGRAAQAIGELFVKDAPGAATDAAGLDAARRALGELLVVAPGPVAELAAVALARLGDGRGVDMVIAVSESKRIAWACEALRALGHVGPGEGREAALTALLSALSPEIGLELQRAAIDGLAALGDRRAIRPLTAHLTTGPEAIADEVAAALRALTGATLGPDALRWDAWVAEHRPPEPPAYTPRGSTSADDIDLPTP